MTSDRTVELMDSHKFPIIDLYNLLRDPETGQYGFPISVTEVAKLSEVVTAVKSLSPLEIRPSIDSKNLINVAIVDTGLMSHHPMLKPFLINSIDFTGEGTEDFIGHGSMVALCLIASLDIELLEQLRLINVKVVPASGLGKEQDLIKGIRWAKTAGVAAMNLSVGVYNKKWLLFDCDGTCNVCREAESAACAGIPVFAAAGNMPGTISCPARIGYLKPDCGVRCTGASDYEDSGLAHEYYPSGHWVFRID